MAVSFQVTIQDNRANMTMNTMSATGLLMLIYWITSSTEAARILLLPFNMNSHVLLFARLGEEMGHLGHKTLLLAPSNAKIPHEMAHENFTIIINPVPEKIPYFSSQDLSEIVVEYALAKSKLYLLPRYLGYFEKILSSLQSDFHNLWRNKDIMRKLENFQFQFAITDFGAGEFSFLIPLHLGIPYASVSISNYPMVYRVPRLSSFSSQSFSDEMTFTERLTTFAFDIAVIAAYNSSVHNINKYVPHLKVTDGFELIVNSSFWLFTEDPALSFPKPHMPNTLGFGDIMARPGRPLSPELQAYLDESSQGVVIVSLGSYFDYIPEFLARRFCEAFRNTDHRIIWKLANNEFCHDADNVRILPWFPQNDILAHKNVKLFITHCGFSSLVEATYHGKPLIVFPMAIEQPSNAAMAVSRGLAIRMDISEFTSNELRQNIETIIQNESYTENARKISSILRDKKETAAERVSFMIEHVLKYGDAHLRTAAHKLSLLEFLMVDIFACLLAILILAAILILVFVGCFCQMLKKCLRKAKKVKVT